jgi:RNA polymerase sigma factor (sigma-70 family)
VNNLVNKHYKYLLKVAKRITRRKDVWLAEDLIHETYLHIYENEKFVPLDDIGFISFFCKYMLFMFIGERSSFNKATKIHTDIEYTNVQIEDNEVLSDLELYVEGTNEATKEMLKELTHLTEPKVKKLIRVHEFKETLPPHLKTIFEFYYESGMSSRQIAELMEKETGYKMDFRRYNDMINEIKEKLCSI